MKVSVIMPFHKGVHFLEDALESLKDQSFKDFELLLIYDHITEDVDKYMVNQYSKHFTIKVANLKDKTGVAAARNLGLSMAKGEYIYFLDSDDYLDANALEYLVSTVENDGADVVYGKKTWTWFQRSLFLRKLYEEEDEEEEEEDDEGGEGDKDSESTDSDQDNADSDGRVEKDSSITDDSDDDKDKQNDD
ncbi:MAG: glycosyltransferase family 2 protein, partial [Clostridiales bacterium]|nr:glycosyltransferase family 2 protein [Clostridiales bacterium]